MLILLAIILVGFAIWLTVQLVGRTLSIDWTPIPSPETSSESDLEDSIRRTLSGLQESLASVNQLGDLAYRQIGPTVGQARGRPQKKPKRERQYDGQFTLPQKVYEGTSQKVSVIIKPGLWRRVTRGERLVVVNENGVTSFMAVVPEGPAGSQSFEVELQAAGITVEGNKTQNKKISDDVITFNWNCAFPTKGDYEITLIVRLKTGRHSIDLGEPVTHRLRVVKYLGLPKQIIAIFVGVSSLAGTLIGILDGGHKLHWW